MAMRWSRSFESFWSTLYKADLDQTGSGAQESTEEKDLTNGAELAVVVKRLW